MLHFPEKQSLYSYRKNLYLMVCLLLKYSYISVRAQQCCGEVGRTDLGNEAASSRFSVCFLKCQQIVESLLRFGTRLENRALVVFQDFQPALQIRQIVL